MAKSKVNYRNLIGNIAVWVLIAGAVALAISTFVVVSQFFVWAFQTNFWGAVSLCSALIMLIAVIVIRTVPGEKQ